MSPASAETLVALVSEHLAAFAGLPWDDLRGARARFAQVPPAALALLRRERAELMGWLEATADPSPGGPRDTLGRAWHRALAEFLRRRNQFFSLPESDAAEVREMVGKLLDGARYALTTAVDDAQLERLLSASLAGFWGLLTRYFEARAAAADAPGLVFAEPACAEYSPALQLEVLGLRPDELLEPVLDLGCGRSAALVRHLVAAGIDAQGLDLDVEDDGIVRPGDWLDTPLTPGHWGTVISHMAFSNHFLHHHLRPEGEAERYARRMLAILGALRRGGRFVYAPGLPFLEDVLPSGAFSVLRLPVAAAQGSPWDLELRRKVGAPVLYASQVTRLT